MLLAALMLLGGEMAVRLRAHLLHGHAGTQAEIYQSDPTLGQVPRPGAVMVTDGAATTINRWGLRGRDCTLRKPPGTIRVLCLGASTTFGQPYDDDSSIWPARLERLLQESSLGASVEVLNGAMPGYTLSQTRLNLEKRLARFEPDVVVVYQAASSISAHALRQFGGSGRRRASRWSLEAVRDRYSLAYMLLRANTAALTAPSLGVNRHDRLDDEGVARFAGELGALLDECQRRGYQVVMCTFPRAFDAAQPARQRHHLAQTALFFNPQLSVKGLIDAYERYNNAIRRVAHRRNAALVDLDRAIPRGALWFHDAIHLSARGHEEAARLVGEVLAPMIRARVRGAEASTVHAVQ